MKEDLTYGTVNKKVLKTVAIMEKEYANPALWEQLKATLDFNEKEFDQYFIILFGMKAQEYLIRKRMKKAAELFNQQLSISQVYQACGYNNIPDFTRDFEKIYGITPFNFLMEKTKYTVKNGFFSKN